MAPYFAAGFYFGQNEITEVAERNDQGSLFKNFFVCCRDLRVGETEVQGETVRDDQSQTEFEVVGSIGNVEPEKAQSLKILTTGSIQRWQLGTVRVAKGESKDPLKVEVKYGVRAISDR